jgi:hypothetical protein
MAGLDPIGIRISAGEQVVLGAAPSGAVDPNK